MAQSHQRRTGRKRCIYAYSVRNWFGLNQDTSVSTAAAPPAHATLSVNASNMLSYSEWKTRASTVPRAKGLAGAIADVARSRFSRLDLSQPQLAIHGRPRRKAIKVNLEEGLMFCQKVRWVKMQILLDPVKQGGMLRHAEAALDVHVNHSVAVAPLTMGERQQVRDHPTPPGFRRRSQTLLFDRELPQMKPSLADAPLDHAVPTEAVLEPRGHQERRACR